MGKVTITLTGDSSSLVRAIKQAEDAQKRLAENARDAGNAMEGAAREAAGEAGKLNETLADLGTTQRSAFSPENITAFRHGIDLITQAAQLALSALREVDQFNEQQAQKRRASAGVEGGLAQFAVGDQAVYQDLLNQAQVFRAAGGAETSEAAQSIIGQLHAAGINDVETRNALIGLRPGVQADENLLNFALSASTLQTNLGKDVTGSVPQLISKAIAASGDSPRSGEEILMGAVQSASVAADLGMTDTDLLILEARAAKAAGDAKRGAVQANAFLSTVSSDVGFRDAIRDGGLEGGLENLRSRGLDTSLGFEGQFGKNREAQRALSGFFGGDWDIQGERDKVNAAMDQNLAAQTGRLAMTSSNVRIAAGEREASGFEEAVSAADAENKRLVDLMNQRERNQLRAQGRGFDAALKAMGAEIFPTMDIDTQQARQAPEGGRSLVERKLVTEEELRGLEELRRAPIGGVGAGGAHAAGIPFILPSLLAEHGATAAGSGFDLDNALLVAKGLAGPTASPWEQRARAAAAQTANRRTGGGVLSMSPGQGGAEAALRAARGLPSPEEQSEAILRDARLTDGAQLRDVDADTRGLLSDMRNGIQSMARPRPIAPDPRNP